VETVARAPRLDGNSIKRAAIVVTMHFLLIDPHHIVSYFRMMVSLAPEKWKNPRLRSLPRELPRTQMHKVSLASYMLVGQI
jgi:hypothetical protein